MGSPRSTTGNLGLVEALRKEKAEHQQPRYWCLNFDSVDVLNYGLANSVWMMQYQYAHGGQTNQGHKIRRITANWNAAKRIKPGDWCVAYLKGSKFYAIGKAISPRKKMTHQDTVQRTLGGTPVTERRHLYYDGVVYYADAAGAFYEDHGDTFAVTWSSSDYEQAPLETYSYPQRIDVDKWQYASKDEALALSTLRSARSGGDG